MSQGLVPEFRTAPKLPQGATHVYNHPSSGQPFMPVPIPYIKGPQYVYRAQFIDPSGKNDPTKHGFKGWARDRPGVSTSARKHNDFFGPDTVWVASSKQGVNNFANEMAHDGTAKPHKDSPDQPRQMGIYQIKNRDTPDSEPKRRMIGLHEPSYLRFAAAREARNYSQDIPGGTYFKKNPYLENRKLFSDIVKYKHAYLDVAKYNGEIVMDGPVDAKDVTHIGTITFTPDEIQRRKQEFQMTQEPGRPSFPDAIRKFRDTGREMAKTLIRQKEFFDEIEHQGKFITGMARHTANVKPPSPTTAAVQSLADEIEASSRWNKKSTEWHRDVKPN